MRALVLGAVLFAGCATHHAGDCFRCAVYVRTQSQDLDTGQAAAIYKRVGGAMHSHPAPAAVAPVKSTS